MRKKPLITLSFLLLIFLVACGRGRDTESRQGNQTVAYGNDAGALVLEGDIYNFTVATPMRHNHMVGITGEDMRRNLYHQGIDLNLLVNYHAPEDQQGEMAHILSQLAAGVGPDIIIMDNGFFLPPFVAHNLLADIYTLIDQSPEWTRGCFFTYALAANEIDGNLYLMPMQFGISYVGINANAPEAFIQRFAALDFAQPYYLMNLYFDLMREYPEWGDFAFINGIMDWQFFEPELNNAIDFSNRTARLNDIVPFMEVLRQAFDGNERFGIRAGWQSTIESITEVMQHYVFYVPSNDIDALFELQEPLFQNFIPLTDQSGRIINRLWMGMQAAVSASTNPSLGWAFLEQLITNTATVDSHRNTGDVPIARRYFEDAVGRGIHGLYSAVLDRELAHTQTRAAEIALERIQGYSVMPINHMFHASYIAQSGVRGLFQSFILGDVSVGDAAIQMEERITAWLNTEHEIVPFIPQEYEPEPTYDFPVRTISTHASNMHTAVFRQAEEAMNEDWRARGIPYIFELEINDYDWSDYMGWGDRVERLSLQLMAGQGPDVLVLAGQSVHAYVNSGLFTDIGALMDACPNTNPDDFYTHVLEAFEIAGGLFIFPVSFSFEYIGINANMPQRFIERFTQYSFISLSQLVDIYMDIMAEYSDDFGHMPMGLPGQIATPSGMLDMVMGGFVDINTRTANLTDPAIIAFLDTLPPLFRDFENHANSWSSIPLSDGLFLRDRAREMVFIAQTRLLDPVNAWFIPETEHFTHFIPFVDEAGRLLIDNTGWGATWAVMAIPAVGDGPLAWEFMQHAARAYSQAEGRALVDPRWNAPTAWGLNSMATPIMRPLFNEHYERAFGRLFSFQAGFTQRFVGFNNEDERARLVSEALEQVAYLNEMPVALISPMLPMHLFEDIVADFMIGIITADVAAQRMHNALSLWLIE